MLRKLAVLLTGSLVRDPYLQILVALLVLVVSCVATAFIQPYEAAWLNAIDTLGLFVLIVTQILSIFYFYVESAEVLTIDPVALDRIVTAALCALNVAMLSAFAVGYAIELLGLRAQCARRRSVVLKVATPAATAAVLAHDGEGRATHFWCHPTGVAVAQPPRRANELGIWVWRAPNLDVAVSTSEPQLLLAVRNATVLSSGDEFRTMNTATCVLSELETQLPDVGGWCKQESFPRLPCIRDRLAPTSNERAPAIGNANGAHSDHSEADAADPREVELRTLPTRSLERERGGESDGVGAQGLAEQTEADREQRRRIKERRSTRATRSAEVGGTPSHLNPLRRAELRKAAGEAPLPAGWGKGEHEGFPCYINLTTRDMQWEVPLEAADPGQKGKKLSLQFVKTTNPGTYFYPDVNDDSVSHGPFSLEKLVEWKADGHFDDSMLVSLGREGELVQLGTVLSQRVTEQ